MKKLSDIPDIDKPREKLATRGVQAFSSHELLMVLLGSGLPGRGVAVLAANILKVIETEKEDIPLDKLTKIQGVGKAKAGQILSAFELAKRYLIKEDNKVRNTSDIRHP